MKKRDKYAKLIDGKFVEYKPVVTESDDGLVVTYTYLSESDLKTQGFKKVKEVYTKNPDPKKYKLSFEYEETENELIRKVIWIKK